MRNGDFLFWKLVFLIENKIDWKVIRVKLQSGHLIKNIYKTYDLVLA